MRIKGKGRSSGGRVTPSTIFVIDTNIVIGTPDLDDVAWKRMFLVAALGGPLEIVVPEVVVREFGRRRAEAVSGSRTAGIKAWSTALRELKAGGIELPEGLPSVRDLRGTDKLSNSDFADELRSKLQDKGVGIAPIPAADHDVLVDRSLRGHPPFDSTDKGYRDALIWETVKHVATTAPAGTEVVFVTNDKDYCGPGTDAGLLHPELVRDLANETSKQVLIAKTLAEAMALTKMDSVHDELTAPELPETFSLSEILASAIPSECDNMLGIDLSEGGPWGDSSLTLALDPDLEAPITISDIAPDMDSLTVDVHETFDGGTEIGEAHVNAVVSYEGHIHKADFAASTTEWDVHDADHNRHYMEVGGSLEVELVFHFLVENESVDALDLQGIAPVVVRN